jgi:hypothetical protein
MPDTPMTADAELVCEPMLFIRDDCFYIVEIPRAHVQANVDLNPGTVRVESVTGEVLWQAKTN